MKEPINPGYSLNDSETNKTQQKGGVSWKMWLIISISILIILALVIIIIVLLMSSKEEKGNAEDEVIPSRGDPIGEIICVLDVNTIKEKTNIIGHEFNKNSVFDFYVDGKLMRYSREYLFDTIGKHTIKLLLFENIDMDYMFHNIDSLTSIEMNSNCSALILSMESTFQNCPNLEKISVNGFSTKGIKSIKKLFYNTSLFNLDLSWLNTSAIEDMSYMFSLTPVISLDLTKLDTNSVKNMSNIFYGCHSLKYIDFSHFNTENVIDMSSMFSSCDSLEVTGRIRFIQF